MSDPSVAPSATAPGAPTPELVLDRPPEGPARGVWAAPAWTVAALGVGACVAAAAWVLRLRRGARR